MSMAVEIVVAMFAVSNSARVVAYVPQMVRVARDREGAAGVSCLTWVLFAVSNLSTVAYAILVVDDWRMAAVFTLNMVCCLCIIGLTVYKRAGTDGRCRRAEAHATSSGKTDGRSGVSGAARAQPTRDLA